MRLSGGWITKLHWLKPAEGDRLLLAVGMSNGGLSLLSLDASGTAEAKSSEAGVAASLPHTLQPLLPPDLSGITALDGIATGLLLVYPSADTSERQFVT